jgi:hypothetical protein
VVFAALACAKTAQRPALVRASARADGVLASWQPALGAAGYRAQLFDLDSGAPLSAPGVTQETHALLSGGFSQAAGVRVTALPGESAIGFVGAGAEGGDGSAWQLFAPEDFRGGALHARFDSLGADERLAVLLVNAGGRDGAQASVEIDGAAQVAQVAAMARSAPQRPLALHAPELTEVPPAAPAEPLAERRSFCVVPGLDFSRHLRKPATLAVSSAHAEFYVDDEDAAEYGAAFLPALAQTFESRVWPSVTSAFGQPTDVDQNGKLLVLLSHELGAHLNGGWLIGYFGNSDLLNARDDSDDCSGGGSNHGEIIFLNDLANGAANGWSADTLGTTIFPGTLAHELQHLLNLGHRCVDRACDGPQPTWLNEALSKVAEDLAGFGWSGDQGRADGAEYLGRSQGDLRGYDGRSLTKWEGDPIGNYQGAHSFLRLFADRLGPSLPAAVASGDLEDALGRPLPRAMAEWATALLMSNETGAAYSFSGAPWSPLHQRLRHLDTLAPGALTLRADGISAVMSGVGQAGPAELIVRSSEELPPHVVVIRAPASLPSR